MGDGGRGADRNAQGPQAPQKLRHSWIKQATKRLPQLREETLGSTNVTGSSVP